MITLRSLAAVLSALFLLGITVLVAVLMLNPVAFKGQFETWASRQLGRQLAIDGDFQLKLGPIVQIAANRVRLANVAWGSQPEMLVAQRLLLELDVRSLFRDTVVIPRIEVDGLDVLLERNADGLNNWTFELPEEETPWPETPPVVVELIAMPGARLRFIGPRLTRPLEVQFDTLDQHPAPDDMLVLSASGRANEVPLHLGASVGPLANLLKGENINFALDGEVGQLTLEGHGRVDDLGTPADTEVALNISGPDSDYVTRVLGFRNLGSGPVKLDAGISPAADRRGISGKLSGVFGELTIDGSGELVDPTNLEKLALQLKVAGPDLSLIGGLLNVNQLPPEAFTLEARFERHNDSLTIDAASLRLRDAELDLHGTVTGVDKLTGNDLSFAVKGSDLERFRKLLRIPGLATGRFEFSGRLKQSPEGRELLDFSATTQLAKFTAAGPLGPYPGFYGSHLKFTAAGADFARFGTALKIAGLPGGAFDARGELDWTEPGVMLKGSTLKVAGDQLTLDGLIGTKPPGRQVDLRIAMQGKDPRLLARLLNQPALPALPALPYNLSGRVRRDQNSWRLDDVAGALAGARLRINGQLGNLPALRGTKLSFAAEGPDLAPFSGVAGRKLPKMAFKAAGNLASVPNAIRLQQLSLSVGNLKAKGDITVGLPVRSSRTDFDISSEGSGLDTLVPELNWLPVARQSAVITARGSWQKDSLVAITALKIQTGGESLSAQGNVSLAPVVAAKALQLNVSTRDLAAYGRLYGLKLPASLTLPAVPMQFAARASGNADAFVLEGVSGTVGDTDFAGRLQVALKGKPNVDIQLQSELLNLSAFSTASSQPTPAKNAAPPKSGLFIPDIQLPLDALNRYNGHLAVRAGTLRIPGIDYTAVQIEAGLKDGQLTANPIQYVNASGKVSGRLDVQQGTGPPLVKLVATGSNLVLEFGRRTANPADRLRYDGQIDLTGRGRTLRELAASLQGKIRLISGTGRLPNSNLTAIYSSFFSELWSTLNPLVKRQPYTDVVCAVYLLRAENGMLHTDPALVLRTTAIDVISNGSVNLRNEAIDFNFKTVARSGIGISIGQMVNPYIKVSGTLAKPHLTLDPTGSLVNGGAAFATGGLSILATTVWDRVFRQKDPCAAAVAESDKRAAVSQP